VIGESARDPGQNSSTAAPRTASPGASAAPWLARYSASERMADRWVHLAGLLLGGIGTAVLLGFAARSAQPGIFAASLIYSASLSAMLVCSTLYHHSPAWAYRRFLRRLDHAAIFLLIAGTYTPFTTCRLHGTAAVAMTAAVWAGALGGAAVKLFGPLRSRGFSTAGYLALGWIALIGLRPILDAVDPQSLILILAGGVIYSIGAGIHRWRSLRFHNAIWHGMVLAAATCHYAAILEGVVLAAS
jgi:hemolysin III